MRWPVSSVLLLLLVAAPATASTVPPLDFVEGKTTLSLGVLDASLDRAVSDRLSLGVSAMAPFFLPYLIPQDTLYNIPMQQRTAFPISVAVRTSYRITELPDVMYLGATLSGGVAYYPLPVVPNPMTSIQTEGFSYLNPWFQPALNLGFGGGQFPLALRFTLGPAMTFPSGGVLLPIMSANIELGARLGTYGELTLGGNSLLGWRAIF